MCLFKHGKVNWFSLTKFAGFSEILYIYVDLRLLKTSYISTGDTAKITNNLFGRGYLQDRKF